MDKTEAVAERLIPTVEALKLTIQLDKYTSLYLANEVASMRRTKWKIEVMVLQMMIPRVGPVMQRMPLIRNIRLDGAPQKMFNIPTSVE